MPLLRMFFFLVQNLMICHVLPYFARPWQEDFPYQEQYELVLEHLRILSVQEQGDSSVQVQGVSAGHQSGDGLVDMEDDEEWSDGEA